MKVFFKFREELALGIWHYTFTPERQIDFVPGQYIDLQLNNVINDLRGAKRTFTLTSLPTDRDFSFIVKHFKLQSPYKETLQRLETGIEANIGDAMGDLILPKLSSQPLVFVAGGIGIASYASMLQYLLARKEEREIFIFYALRAYREQLFRNLMDAYPLQLIQLSIAPNRLSAEEILYSIPQESQIYLSGSQKFVEGLYSDLASLGISREQIVFDYYDGYMDL